MPEKTSTAQVRQIAFSARLIASRSLLPQTGVKNERGLLRVLFDSCLARVRLVRRSSSSVLERDETRCQTRRASAVLSSAVPLEMLDDPRVSSAPSYKWQPITQLSERKRRGKREMPARRANRKDASSFSNSFSRRLLSHCKS